MPRKARIDAPGCLHHIIARGIERQLIYEDDTDRENFIARLETILVDTRTACYAWALMPNHFHLLLRTGAAPLPTLMRRLLTGYAISFNHRHRRHGHLFQNRYKSILCQRDAYQLELVRYIHLNPLRAGMVAEFQQLHHYPYTGHSAVLGRYNRIWQDTASVLKLFGGTVSMARRRYREFIQKGIEQGRRSDLVGGGLVRSAGGWTAVKTLRRNGFFQKADERILGDGDFVATALKQAEEQLERRYHLKARGYDFESVVNRVGILLGLEPAEVLTCSKCRGAVAARSLVCFWAHRDLGLSQIALAEKFGVSQPAVSAAVRKGEEIAKAAGYELIET